MSKNKKTTKKVIPFWLQIAIILLCGVVLGGVMYGSVKWYKHSEEEKNKPMHTVTFAYQDGKIIDTKQVKEGLGVFPPKLETEYIFRGWSGVVNNVTSDIEVHPILYAVSDENLFCFDSMYVKEGDEFTIDLKLTGEVNICDANLKIQYDTEVMTFVSAKDCNSCKVSKSTDGELLLKLNGDSSIKNETSLSKITFKALQKDVYSSQIDLGCSNAKLSNGEPAIASTLNNEIFYLQEVR